MHNWIWRLCYSRALYRLLPWSVVSAIRGYGDRKWIEGETRLANHAAQLIRGSGWNGFYGTDSDGVRWRITGARVNEHGLTEEEVEEQKLLKEHYEQRTAS